MSTEAAIRAFRPRGDDDIVAPVRAFVAALRAESVLGAREPWTLRAADGSLVLVLEWASPHAERRAQDDPAINEAMADIEAVAEEISLDELDEAGSLVAAFECL